MTDQLPLEPLPDRAALACGHHVPFDREGAARLADGWYAAVRCPECGKAVGVTLVAYARPEEGTLRTAGGDPPREDGSSAEAAGLPPLRTR